jgi:basic amino acid/polyamine antiporter, APA family
MMSFGAIVGVGWITILGYWLERAGPGGSVAALAFGAGAVLLVAANYGLLSRLELLCAQGEVGAIARALGRVPAFVATAALTLAYLSIVAFEAVSAGWIVVTLLPAVEGPTLYSAFGHDVHLGNLLVAVGGICMVAALNLRSLSAAASAQNAIVLLKIAVTALFCVASAIGGDVRNLLPLLPESSSSAPTIAGVLGVAATMPLWYAGFNVTALLASERDRTVSSATVARLMCVSVLAACAFYVCVVLAASMAMPWRSLIAAPLPATAGFRHGLHSALLANAVLVAGLLGIISAWISCFAAAARVLTALRAQLQSTRLGEAQMPSAPSRATMIAVATVAILLTTSDRAALVPIVNVASMCFGIVYLLISCVALRCARLRKDRLLALLGCGVSVFMACYVIVAAVQNGGWLAPELLVVMLWTAVSALSWSLRSGRSRR